MAEAQNEIYAGFSDLIAAGLGISPEADKRDVLPYNPAILQGLAGSDEAMSHGD